MKRNFRLLAAGALAAMLLPSCITQTTYMLTDNPVGSKTGVAKLSLFGKDKDISIMKAAKNGKIEKIGTVEMKVTQIIIIPIVKTTVTGE